MYLPVHPTLFFHSLNSAWIILSFLTFLYSPCYFPWWWGTHGEGRTETRGLLSMSASDRSGAAFTLSKRAEPSLLISPRTAQSQGVGGLWKLLLSQWVSTLSPPLNPFFPPATHPPAPSAQLNHSQLRGGGGGGRRSRRAKGWNFGSISNNCDWFPFEWLSFPSVTHIYSQQAHLPPMVSCHVLWRNVCLTGTGNEGVDTYTGCLVSPWEPYTQTHSGLCPLPAGAC